MPVEPPVITAILPFRRSCICKVLLYVWQVRKRPRLSFGPGAADGSGLQESQQIFVEAVPVRHHQAMGSAVVDLQSRALASSAVSGPASANGTI
jgi:hypothetical protein